MSSDRKYPRPLFRWAPVVLYMALIFAISSISQPPELPSALPDKGAHALLYFGLGALFVRALAGGWTRPVTWRVAAAAVIYSSLYGVTDEVHQYFVPPREVEALDVVADAAGAALAAGVLYLRACRPGKAGLSADAAHANRPSPPRRRI